MTFLRSFYLVVLIWVKSCIQHAFLCSCSSSSLPETGELGHFKILVNVIAFYKFTKFPDVCKNEISRSL